MEWTKARPTVDGYYWYQSPLNGGPFQIRVAGQSYFYFGDNDRYALATLYGYFYGPVTPPPFNPNGIEP